MTKPVHILGISAFYHDSAACLLRDGEIIAAASEERFTRKKGDSDFPARGRGVLPQAGRNHPRRPRLRRVLRQAPAQVRADPRDLPRRRPAGLQVVPDGRPALDQGEALPGQGAPRRARRLRGQAALRRAPRVARRQRLLPVAVRGGRHPHDGRRRRVGHDHHRRRAGQRDRAHSGNPLARFARPALLGVHLLHRLQGQLRRVQGHGPRALRRSRSTWT